jgi:hypothetical protein
MVRKQADNRSGLVTLKQSSAASPVRVTLPDLPSVHDRVIGVARGVAIYETSIPI